MNAAQKLLHVLPQSVPFVDHTGIPWEEVRRVHYWLYQRFRYQYPGPVRDLHQRLVVVPPGRHGNQYLCGHKINVTAAGVSIGQSTDDWGNPVYTLDLPQVDGTVDFEVWISVERVMAAQPWPTVSQRAGRAYLQPSALTEPDEALRETARQLAAENGAGDAWTLAERINQWVYQYMTYKSGVTHVGTTAAQAFQGGQGLCQDYSHIMISLCRLLGLPARYVSGHLLGEGGSHAWVEVILPSPDAPKKLVAVAFDPTNHCRAGMRHITVAVGRDYRDVSPTSGYFTGPYAGRLTSSKQAGIVTVEYDNGEFLSIDDEVFAGLEETARQVA